MPATTYNQYKDPETGEIMWIPQLFPHSRNTGEILPEELEEWLRTDLLPKELYESHISNHEKMEEIHKRFKDGEQVTSSELPTKTWALTEYLLKNKARIYGETVLTRIFSNLTNEDQDIIWLSFVKEALTSIASEDPLAIHQYIARKTLKEKYKIDDPRAVDILSRDLVEHCGNIVNKLKTFKHLVFENPQIDLIHLSDRLKHETESILQLDADFIEYLKSIGKKGKELAKIVEQNSKALFGQYENSGYSSDFRRHVWGLWVNNEGHKEAPFLSVLCQVLWEDKSGRLWNRDTKQVPALAKPVLTTVIKPLMNSCNKKTVKQVDNQIVCSDQAGLPLFYAPTIDPDMIAMLQRGVNSISSLTGHKLLRWQIKTGFEQWCKEESDPRLIEIDGGYSRIAELAGCSSTKEIAKVKEILHAQAHGQFVFPDNSRGNMIILRVLERYRNTEPSKIRLILGDMLFPTFIFRIGKNEGRRLIPIGDLPPLQGSKNSHAFQAQLQLLVFEEFSNQSDRIAEQGAAHIPLHKWHQMAEESGLKADKVEKIIDYWCQPDLYNCFLDRQGDEYCLSSYYEKAQRFLIQQGKQRMSNSQRGKASAAKRERDKQDLPD